jgi:hypothetical protein
MRLLLSFLLLIVAASVQARLPAPVQDAERWRVQGAGEMRWFGFAIYDARLWRSGEQWQSDAPYALELTYRRNISAAQLVSTSIEEMMRLGEKDEQRLRQWRAELEKIFPSVREGDTIVGLHEPGRGARFFYNGKPSGRVNDAELAAAFFAIWLDPRTKAPELRARLLAAGGK